MRYVLFFSVLSFFLSCQKEGSQSQNSDQSSDAQGSEFKAEIEKGGLLYDKWSLFVDRISDTLVDVDGVSISAEGHGHRCKSCHGWDYKGAQGFYKEKSYATPFPLYDSRTKPLGEIVEVIRSGGHGMPAYRGLFSDEQVKQLAYFIKYGQKNTDELFTLIDEKPGLELLAGGNSERGNQLYKDGCQSCHGATGESFLIGGKYSLGSHMRQKSYEDHHKVSFGQPGTSMGPGYSKIPDLLDLFAAFCNFETYPAGGSKMDLESEQRACRAYL